MKTESPILNLLGDFISNLDNKSISGNDVYNILRNSINKPDAFLNLLPDTGLILYYISIKIC